MFCLFLALRYTFSRVVSYISMTLILFGVASLIVVVSVMSGFLRETRALIRGTTADVVVFPAQDPDGGWTIAAEDLLEVARAVPGVEGACPRLVRPAVFKVSGSPANIYVGNSQHAALNQVLVLGIDPDTERAVTDLDAYLGDVDDPRKRVADAAEPFRIERGLISDVRHRNADLPTVLLGEPLMRALGVERGDGVTFVTVPDGEALEGTLRTSSETFIVSGAFRTGHQEFDRGHVMVTIPDFRLWAGTRQDVSELYVRVAAGHSLDAVRDELEVALARRGIRAEVETWLQRHWVLIGAVENERMILAILLMFFVGLVCISTFAMLWTMVAEKTRDIGILAAMGATPFEVGSIFAITGLVVSGIGGALGFAVGELVADNVNAVKDFIEDLFGVQIFNEDVYAFTDLPSQVDSLLNAGMAGATVAFGVLICLLPACRAAFKDPVLALRHE